MFKPIKGGSEYILKDAFEDDVVCHLPPVGYGVNSITGKLDKTIVVKRSSKKAEQYWERTGLPQWYIQRREEEEIVQETDPDYVDPKCEEWREREWNCRLCGMWFYNNGVPTYITGTHWLMLEHWIFQSKPFNFRIPNMEFFYMWDYCVEDPSCLGLNEITKRKDGKTARAGVILFEYISRTAGKHGGIQSKTDDDAAEVFKKAVVTPWTKLPHYFRPIYDTSKGDDPDTEMRFFNPSRKGVRKNTLLKAMKKEAALESFIDFKARTKHAYDGPELHRYVSDESGKLKDVSIMDRHNVNRFCSEVDGEYIGKHLYTTTVEEMEAGGSEFKKLTYQCDRKKRDANGRTLSGMYCYFLPAYRTLKYDVYGFPDEEYGKTYFLNQRKAYEEAGDTRSLASFIRKNPFTLREAFIEEGETCLYDPMVLNNQLDAISWRKDSLLVRGDFVWKNGERFTEVEFRENKAQGKVYMCAGLLVKEPNKVVKRGDNYVPAATFEFVIGCDPFKYDKVKSNRRSDCAAWVYKKEDQADKNNPYNDTFVCRYRYRAATTAIQYEDVLKMAWYFGAQVLFESNVDNWKDYFKSNGCGGFLLTLPGEKEPGLYSDGQGKVHQQIADYTESYINSRIDRCYFPTLISEWLIFTLDKTTDYDEAMAAGYTLIAARNKIYKRTATQTRQITDYVRKYKAA